MSSFDRRKSRFPLISIWTQIVNGRDLYNYFCLSYSVVHSKLELHCGSISKVYENSQWIPSLHSLILKLTCQLGTRKHNLSSYLIGQAVDVFGCKRDTQKAMKRKVLLAKETHLWALLHLQENGKPLLVLWPPGTNKHTKFIRSKTNVKIIKIKATLNFWYKVLSNSCKSKRSNHSPLRAPRCEQVEV